MGIEDIVAAVPPTKVKPQEVDTYNPVWVDCSVDKAPFVPMPTP